MNRLNYVIKIWNTTRYMTLRQWFFRSIQFIRKGIVNKKRKPSSFTNVIPLPMHYQWNITDSETKQKREILEPANKILSRTFPTVSGESISFLKEIDWDMRDNSYRLKCFRLNSFSYLLFLSDAYKLTKDKKYIEYGFYLIDDWQKKNGETIKGDKWNPYVIAERIINWIAFVSCYATEADKNILNYADYIQNQAMCLSRTLEYQIGGNHLLSEGKAILYAGTFLKDKTLCRKAKKLLEDEFSRQFLIDGGHYERSISYHVESLQQYFESVVLMMIQEDPDAERFRKMLIKPYIFLNAMIGCNGRIPLVNDAAYDYPFDAADFLSTSQILFQSTAPRAKRGEYFSRWNIVKNLPVIINWDHDSLFRETGFLQENYSVGEKNYSLFFDAGNNGPDENPAHAHADALNLLWACENENILVDTGVYTYQPGKGRDYCRSTSAHNTVEIDGENSAEVWSAFRVARRGHTKIIKYKNGIEHLEIIASHDGYKKCLKNPVLHTRSLKLNKKSGEIRVLDTLTGGKHVGVLRYHLASGCDVIKKDDYTVQINGHILFQCTEKIEIETCEIAEFFGVLKESKCINAKFSMNGKKQFASVFKII